MNIIIVCQNPPPPRKAKADRDKKTLRQAQDEKGKKENDEAEKKKSEAQNEGEKKPKKPLEKVFYSVNKEGNLNQLSFLTTNPLQVYWSSKAGSAKPRIARVLYTLKEEKRHTKII